MPALQREAAWAEERLLGDLRQSVPEKRLRPFTHYRFEVPWTWEKESRGPKPKSLKKVSKKVSRGRAPKVRKKSRKRSEKSKKSLKMGFWRLFGPFSRLFSDFWDPGPGRLFRDFFETFWLLAPRLLLPGPRNLNYRSIHLSLSFDLRWAKSPIANR